LLISSVLGWGVVLFLIYSDVALEQDDRSGPFVIGEIERGVRGDLGVIGKLDDILKIMLLVKFAKELVAPKEVLSFLLLARSPLPAVLAKYISHDKIIIITIPK
jgi:hypothetical protein